MLMASSFPVGVLAQDKLSSSLIAESLFTYPLEKRFIKEAWYSDMRLQAAAEPFAHPFHEPWIQHFSREHTVTYATQASYVLIGAIIERGDFAGLSKSHYLDACRHEAALISALRLRFQRRAAVPRRVTITAEVEAIRRRGNSAYAKFRYQIADIVAAEAWLTCPMG